MHICFTPPKTGVTQLMNHIVWLAVEKIRPITKTLVDINFITCVD